MRKRRVQKLEDNMSLNNRCTCGATPNKVPTLKDFYKQKPKKCTCDIFKIPTLEDFYRNAQNEK